MKRLRLRILAIAILAPVAAFGAIGSASAAPHSPAAVRAVTAASTTAVPQSEVNLNPGPRIGCGGMNGHIEWAGNAIQSWGEAWDTCGSGTYVQIFLTWTSPTVHNIVIATAGPNSTVGFNTGVIYTLANVGNISTTACEHDNGWHCGNTIHV